LMEDQPHLEREVPAQCRSLVEPHHRHVCHVWNVSVQPGQSNRHYINNL
jgi:hypothetical protein